MHARRQRGRSFQCLIGEIVIHEGFVEFVEIGGIVFTGNLRRFRAPYLVASASAYALCHTSKPSNDGSLAILAAI